MYCRKCQRELQEHSAYCPYCGTKQSRKVSKWIISLTLVSCLLAVIMVTYIVAVRPVKDTEYAIEEIGSVKMESLIKIEGAEALYESLSENAKTRVNNYSLLKDARDTYDRMETSIQNAVDAIEAAKNATFYADEQPLVLAGDQDVVEKARIAYDALEADDLTEYVEDHLVDLVNAEKGLEYTLGMDMYSAAIEKADQGQYQEAIDIYRELMATYPNHELAIIAPLSLSPCIDALAKIEADANRYEDALSLYQQALEVNPIDVEAMTGAMNCTIRLLEPEFKEENLEMIVKILDKAHEAYGNTEEYDAFRQKVQKMLDDLRPRNGKVLDNKLNWGYCKFTVSAGDQDALIKLESTDDPSKYLTLYVRANESATTNVADGTYEMKYAAGGTWYGSENLFGENTVFTMADDILECETTYSGSYIHYSTTSITLYGVEGGTMSTYEISEDEF